jgi:hypothetical protein
METAYAGTSHPNGVTLWLKEQPGKPERQVTIKSTHEDIDPEFWREWTAENPKSPLLLDGVVWGAINVPVVVHEADEQDAVSA